MPKMHKKMLKKIKIYVLRYPISYYFCSLYKLG